MITMNFIKIGMLSVVKQIENVFCFLSKRNALKLIMKYIDINWDFLEIYFTPKMKDFQNTLTQYAAKLQIS